VIDNRPLLVGITGGIGSGKSLVTRIFSLFGVPVYDADSRAKALMEQDESLKQEIISLIGPEAYTESGKLVRSAIAAKVFSDPGLTERINGLVHPKVKEDSERWVHQYPRAPYLVKEAALMYESGSYQQMDVMVMVYAPENLRVQRVMMRDLQRSEQEIRNIIARQMSDEEKKKRADHVITNDESRLIIPQVVNLHQKFSESKR
jgi:dephospho-CoA kinase